MKSVRVGEDLRWLDMGETEPRRVLAVDASGPVLRDGPGRGFRVAWEDVEHPDGAPVDVAASLALPEEERAKPAFVFVDAYGEPIE